MSAKCQEDQCEVRRTERIQDGLVWQFERQREGEREREKLEVILNSGRLALQSIVRATSDMLGYMF